MTQSAPPRQRLETLLWGRDPSALPAWQRVLLWGARLVTALARDLTQGYLSLQAMSLVYTTLLSLVPLLAVSFSVLKGFGVHNQLEPLLLNALHPLGDQAAAITERIISFVDNMRVGVLGSVGLAMLLYTVLSLIHKIEQVFNYTWRVTEPRSFGARFSQYLSVLLIGPLLFFIAVGLSASVSSNLIVRDLMAAEPLGPLIEALGQLGPYLMITLTFTFFYRFIPNTRVRILPAVVGALVAGLLWEVVGGVFAAFMASSTRFMAIYSSLAILVLLMIWIYIAWLILLIGASIAFYVQNPEYLTIRSRDLRLSNRLRERLALLLAGHIARRHLTGEAPWRYQELARALGVPKTNAERMLGVLETEGFVLRTAADPSRYVPARAPDSIPVSALLVAVRCFEEIESGCHGASPDPEVGRLEARIAEALDQALAGITLRDLAEGLGSPSCAVRAPTAQRAPTTHGGPGLP